MISVKKDFNDIPTIL